MMEGRADLEQAAHQCDLESLETVLDEYHDEPTTGAWLTVAGSFLVYFVSFGFINSFGYFQEYYSQEYLADFSPSVIAIIGTLQLGLLYITGPAVGVLFDAYGLKWLYLVGGAGAVISCLGLSFSQPRQIWQQFLSQGLLFGLTVAFGTHVALSVAGQNFKQKRSLVMGIVASGSSAGGVCFPIMFSHLVPRIGFHWTLRVTALIFLCCYAIAICISRPRLPRQPLKSASQILDFAGFLDPRYSVLAMANLVGNFGLYVPYYYIESYMLLYHPDTHIGMYLLPLLNGSSFFGRISGGFVSDKIGGLNLLYPTTIVNSILCLTMWLFATGVGPIVTFTCLYGFLSGIFISVTTSAVARISPDDKIGARLGAFCSLSAIGVFTGTPIGGAFLHHGTEHDFKNLIIYAGTSLAASGALLFTARILCDRNLRVKW
ncbi:Fc.00g080930.m01.CDS01 [Cosmosporella sp. VM-42]